MIEQSTDAKLSVKLKYGMVGGGHGAFIGDVHRKAINLDGLAEIAAGCFSRTADITRATGAALGIAADRCYSTFEEMAEVESKLSDKIDFVVITAPNYAHYAAAKAFLSRGFHVVCEKPFTWEPSEAEELAALAKKNKLLVGITYTYTGYPVAKQIREMIRRGEIGDIRFVMGEYPQEWLATYVEKTDSRQAKWRTDPKVAGKSNCVGDIGSHIENTVSYMTGLKIKSLCARLDKTLEGRTLDDNASVMLNYSNGARGMYWSSQIAVGYDNGLWVRIFGSKGTIEWDQELPNYFKVYKIGEPCQSWSRGRDGFYPHAQSYSRVPGGHPEGYFEALGNLYTNFIHAVTKVKAGETPSEADMDFPGTEMGIDGVKYITRCVESSDKGAVWVDF